MSGEKKEKREKPLNGIPIAFIVLFFRLFFLRTNLLCFIEQTFKGTFGVQI